MLSYEESGKGNNVLVVHGNFASLNWWRDLLDSPPENMRIIAPNLPGFAGTRSSKSSPTIEDYAFSLVKFIHSISLRSPLYIVGHSLGGAVVQEMLVRYPSLFDGAMLLDSASPNGYKSSPMSWPAISSLKYNRASLEFLTKQAMSQNIPDNFSQLVDDAKNMAHPQFVGNMKALNDWYLKVHNFDKPVYVVGGKEDKLITEDIICDTATRFKRNRVFMIEGASHSPQIENYVTFRNILGRFISEC